MDVVFRLGFAVITFACNFNLTRNKLTHIHPCDVDVNDDDEEAKRASWKRRVPCTTVHRGRFYLHFSAKPRVLHRGRTLVGCYAPPAASVVGMCVSFVLINLQTPSPPTHQPIHRE